MSLKLLLEDAKKLAGNSNKLKQARTGIKRMKFCEKELSAKEFHRLVFMQAPSKENWEKSFPLRNSICGKSLETIVEKIKNKGSNPVEIFHKLSKGDDWFEQYLVRSVRFDPRLMGHLWVRDLRAFEEERGINGSFYIEDGSHRALVYALYLAFPEQELDYDKTPVMVYHAKTWEHILPWARP